MQNVTEDVWCPFDPTYGYVDTVLFSLISICATFGNIVVFLCYIKFRCLRNVTNIFMLSLSASDLLVAVVSVPLTFRLFVCRDMILSSYPKVASFIYFTADMFPSILSIYSLTLVAVDRALAIGKPFIHQERVTKNNAWRAVVVMWTTMLLFVLLKLIPDSEEFAYYFTVVTIIVAYGAPVTVLVICYSVMGVVACRHAAVLRGHEKTSLRLKNTVSLTMLLNTTKSSCAAGMPNAFVGKQQSLTSKIRHRINSTSFGSVKSKAKTMRRELKAAFTLSTIVACFIVCWTPFIALNIRYLVCTKCGISGVLIKYFKMLHYSSSAINPGLYVLLNKRWRRAFRKVLTCHSRRSKRSGGSTFLYDSRHSNSNAW